MHSHITIPWDEIKTIPREKFKLIFCTNTARSFDDVSEKLVDDEMIDVFDLERFNNIHFQPKAFGTTSREFSNQLDIYHSTEAINQGKAYF